MRIRLRAIIAFVLCSAVLAPSCGERGGDRCTVPMTLDHNRMLVEAEIQRADGSWRPVRLWVDSGNPSFLMSAPLARDLGLELPMERQNVEVPPPAAVRIGGMEIDFSGIQSVVMYEPGWIFSAMHSDATLPATVLRRYRVVLDYPRRLFTLAKPGRGRHHGERVPASVHPETGIVSIDAVVGGDVLSFALDNGASYSFVSGDVLDRLVRKHPDWRRTTGAVGCANMWGWWPPGEESVTVARIPEMLWGTVRLDGVGVVGSPPLAADGLSLGAWYSHKTARRVDGFLGPNAFKAFRIEIDYAGEAVYFEKGAEFDTSDMDMVGLTLRPEADGGFTVIGVPSIDGRPGVEGVEPGDRLLRVEKLETTGATMGAVIDALRGAPGERRTLALEREGRRIVVEAEVRRYL